MTSIAPSPTFIASAALDRFTRIHSTSLPPQQAGHQVEKKGDVLEKVYVKTTPTVIIWDGDVASSRPSDEQHSDIGNESEDEGVWDGMEPVGDSDEEDIPRGRKRKIKSQAG